MRFLFNRLRRGPWPVVRASNPLFATLVLLLIVAFVCGGSARSDIQSLLILRPVAILLLGYGLWKIRRDNFNNYRVLFLMFGATLVLIVSHLVPLPPEIWQNLPGREIIANVDALIEINPPWRPISMVPTETWNAFFAAMIPLAAFILLAQFERRQLYSLLPILIGISILSGFLGLLQVIGPDESPLYLYRITNNGAAVGLFANRNHQAVFLACSLPMLAIYASARVATLDQARMRFWLSIVVGAVVIPLILVTGSRAGLLTGLIGLVSIPFLYRPPQVANPRKRKLRETRLRYFLVPAAILALTIITVLMSRAEAIDRLMFQNSDAEGRLMTWGPILTIGMKYFPVGSGIGTFVEIYQIDEPTALLAPNYLNHAHNDWLEIFMTVGLPGLIFLIIGVSIFIYAGLHLLFKSTERSIGNDYARLGIIIILILLLASIVDYPLRTPSLAVFFTIAAMWVSSHLHTNSKKTGEP